MFADLMLQSRMWLSIIGMFLEVFPGQRIWFVGDYFIYAVVNTDFRVYIVVNNENKCSRANI